MPIRRALRHRKPEGTAPGTLMHIGERKTERVRLRAIDYTPEAVREHALDDPADARAFRNGESVSWVNVDGLHETDVIRTLGELFGIHPLVLEDILNTEHRPKFEDHERYLFITLKMLQFDEETASVVLEQVSLVLGANYVISFQERPGDVFDPVRRRLDGGKGRIRGAGPDYLAYALLDCVVDHYFSVLEKLGNAVEALEHEIAEDPDQRIMREIHRLKREMVTLRRSVWPLREVLSALERQETALIQHDTRLFLRDVYDHTVQVIDSVESQRELVTGLLDLYLSSVSNKMNEVMKVLTIIATIFIPLSFVAGLYGMNFNPDASPWNMPELDWYWGYPAILALMAAVGVGMLVYFKRKKWM